MNILRNKTSKSIARASTQQGLKEGCLKLWPVRHKQKEHGVAASGGEGEDEDEEDEDVCVCVRMCVCVCVCV